MRSLPEWIGKTDDQKVPDRVRLRIFERYGRSCYLTGRPIRPGDQWDLEHIKGLAHGGEHRESNLAPALKAPHRLKTSRERAVQAKSDRIRKRQAGIRKPRSITGWRKFDGTPVRATRER